MPDWTYFGNLAAAAVLGMAIGLERQWRQHPAGLRTITLVSVGACLFVSLTLLMDDRNSPTRVASYVVSGLGFLGGGVIIRDGLTVKGLNTAASLWCGGAVGTLCGAGFTGHALAGTAAVLLINVGLRPVGRWIDARTKLATDVETTYRLTIEAAASRDDVLRHVLLRHVNGSPKLSLQGIATADGDAGRVTITAEIYAQERSDRAIEEVVARVSIEPEVKAVRWERTTA